MTAAKLLLVEPFLARLLALAGLRHSAVSLALVLLHLSPDQPGYIETHYDDLSVWLAGSRNTIGRRLHELEQAGLVELDRVARADGKRHGPGTPYRIRLRDDGAPAPCWRWHDLPTALDTVLPLLADAQLGPNVAAAYLRAAAAADEHGQLLVARAKLADLLGFSRDAGERHLRQLARFGLLELAESPGPPRQLKLAFSSELMLDPALEQRRLARICAAHDATSNRRLRSQWKKLKRQHPLRAAAFASQHEWSTIETGVTIDELRDQLARITKPLLPATHRELLEQIILRTAKEQQRSFSGRELRNSFFRPVVTAIRSYRFAHAHRCLQNILATEKMPNSFERYYAAVCAKEYEKSTTRSSQEQDARATTVNLAPESRDLTCSREAKVIDAAAAIIRARRFFGARRQRERYARGTRLPPMGDLRQSRCESGPDAAGVSYPYAHDGCSRSR